MTHRIAISVVALLALAASPSYAQLRQQYYFTTNQRYVPPTHYAPPSAAAVQGFGYAGSAIPTMGCRYGGYACAGSVALGGAVAMAPYMQPRGPSIAYPYYGTWTAYPYQWNPYR